VRKPTLWGECLSEFLGTLILVFFGVGAVNAAVLSGAQQGLWQVAVVWAVGIALAIYATGAVSGTHINPAITIAMTAWRGFPKSKVVPYILAQLAGAMAGSFILYSLYHGLISHLELATVARGLPGSENTAMVFGEYFPNPALKLPAHTVTLGTAMLGEGVGTAFLACFVFALTERRNPMAPRWMAPLFIGLTVAIIISIVAPLTQAGLNPARDFGPRLVSYLLGWGSVAIPGPRGGFFTVYIVSPILGALFGAGVYEYMVRRHLPIAEETPEPAEARDLVEVA
jgi:glycerol uptake facilitator protein